MKVWVCAECKTPVELRESDDGLSVFCPSDEDCTPREDRMLLCDFQVEPKEVEGSLDVTRVDKCGKE